jgi:hypothetical protein
MGTLPQAPRTYNQNHIPRAHTGGRRISIYWTWSYPWEAQRDPASMANRFSTITEVRNVLWPAYETPEYDAANFLQGIAGTLELFHRSALAFQELAEESTGHPVAVYQRIDQAGYKLLIDERVLADRPHGVVDPPLQVILSVAFPIISAVYLGIAEGARDHVVALLDGRRDDVVVQRQLGLIDARLRVASWALEGALRSVGDDPQPSMATVADVMAMKREVALAGIEVCDLAMELAGGSAYFRGSPIERAYRDIRAAKFHPFTPEDTLIRAGRLALGLDT